MTVKEILPGMVLRSDYDALAARLAEAERLIAEHNAGCIAACDYQGQCSPYTTRGMHCGSCTRDWLIERTADSAPDLPEHSHDEQRPHVVATLCPACFQDIPPGHPDHPDSTPEPPKQDLIKWSVLEADGRVAATGYVAAGGGVDIPVNPGQHFRWERV